MINRTRSLVAASLFAALVFLSITGSAYAQGVPWGGCGATTVCNNTGCVMTLNLVTNPAGAIPPIVVPPGPCPAAFPTPGVVSIDWVVSGAGFAYPVVPLAPLGFPVPPTTCGAGTWHTPCMSLPAATCCADVCFDPVTCTITINPATCPPVCCRP